MSVLAELALITLIHVTSGGLGSGALLEQSFTASARGEAIAVVRASCTPCSWRDSGREAAVVALAVDGVYSQHLVLVRGEEHADYAVALGHVAAGPHRVTISRDRALSAPAAGPARIERLTVSVKPGSSDEGLALSMSPVLYARANTVGRFTDVPILMWYEVLPTARGRQFRYSVVFTNEDGGTETDRLMATWGRTTDIEYVYGVEVDAGGHVLSEEIQAAGHKYPPFEGRHETGHALLWVDTDNNMVADRGSTSIRYAPAAERFDLTNTSREAVMDAHPWSYRVAADEMAREGKIEDDAAPGSGHITDPRRFLYVEGCTELRSATLALSILVRDVSGKVHWIESDRGLPEFRVARTGCFRSAVPMPGSATKPLALRFRAFAHPDKNSIDAPFATLTRVNRVFGLDNDYVPRPSMLEWTGSLALPVDGDWRALPPH